MGARLARGCPLPASVGAEVREMTEEERGRFPEDVVFVDLFDHRDQVGPDQLRVVFEISRGGPWKGGRFDVDLTRRSPPLHGGGPVHVLDHVVLYPFVGRWGASVDVHYGLVHALFERRFPENEGGRVGSQITWASVLGDGELTLEAVLADENKRERGNCFALDESAAGSEGPPDTDLDDSSL